MGILSKTDLKKRILVGEKLIYKKIRNDKRLDEETIKRLEEHLEEIFKVLQGDDKVAWQNYSKELTLKPGVLSERRFAIDGCVKDIFLHKDEEEIENKITELLDGDENLEALKGRKGKIPFPIFVDDIDYVCFRAANYDLRLGENIYVTTEKTPRKLTAMGADGVLTIEPGEFGILMTHEYLFIPPDLIGFISIRLTFKQKGLVNISGFHADPGFYGRLVFAVFNAGPNDVPLRCKEQVFMIMFNKLTKPWTKVEESKWQGMKDIPIETIFGLRGTSVSVRNLDERIGRLEILFPILVTLLGSILVAVIVWILSYGIGK
jgi:dCTP deaminase